MKKILSLALSLVMLSFFAFSVSAEQESAKECALRSDDVVILYTNDVHTYIEGTLSYDVVSAIKHDLEKTYKYVFLVDAGDHIQGTAYGSMDGGKSIIEMMNKAGYDVATLGNHEFDYGMEGCLSAINNANFPYVSANFYHVENGERAENVLSDYVIFDCGKEKVAFVGITTPETFEKSTSAYFKDENGNFIYGISAGMDASLLQNDVQRAIDEAKTAGATKIIALGHLGIDPSSSPWTSKETISNVSGLDAFIDGHSHSTIEGEFVSGKDSKEVLLTQTGSYFDSIGIMIIDSKTEKITTDLIKCEDILAEDGKTVLGQKIISDLYARDEICYDGDVKEIKDKWICEINEKLGEVIGSSKVTFDNYDADGNRLVRSEETNTGDFCADALYYFFDDIGLDVDAAIMNGGGIRNTAIFGDISYKTCKDIHTFGNVACLQTVTGKQILDALEWGARYAGKGENGGFLHVSGITYKIDPTVENTVKEDEIGTWLAGPEKYRVYDVCVFDKELGKYVPLDEHAQYNLAGYNYTLRNLGDGYAMFEGAVNVLDYVSEDYMVLANYVKAFEDGIVDAQNSPLKEKYSAMLINYEQTSGSGRIEICERETQGEFKSRFEDVSEEDSFFESVCYVETSGLMSGVSDSQFAPYENLTRAMFVTILYRAEGEPKISGDVSFGDVKSDSYYANAVIWAEQNNLVNGVDEKNFAPNKNVTREQIATVMLRYAKYKNISPVGAWAIKLEYSDTASISNYAVEGVMYCTLSGIMFGNESGEFEPKRGATRAEIAYVFYSFATVERK